MKCWGRGALHPLGAVVRPGGRIQEVSARNSGDSSTQEAAPGELTDLRPGVGLHTCCHAGREHPWTLIFSDET